MDFFEHQDRARRQTGKLIFLFSIAVLSILVAVNLALWLTWIAIVHYDNTVAINWLSLWLQWWHNPYGMLTIGSTLFLIFLGSLLQWLQLATGGPAVAQKVGARPISDFNNNAKVTQYHNVVSEMAIASGMPVPQLFVMDREPGINAFVAGYQLSDTVMVVTQGLLDTLDRDQLQAVTGHEFSHIRHGDMRLNLQLMALLSGIVMIGQFGLFLIDTSRHRSYRRSKKDSSAVPILVLGIGLWLIGNIGVFFARIIKAAVSRQREYLADASAVQFTRNPQALAGALYKILDNQLGSTLTSRHKEAISHLCIGATSNPKQWFGNLQTHPPLADRIDRIAPQFRVLMKHQERTERFESPQPTTVQTPSPLMQPFSGGQTAPLLTAQTIMATVGTAKALDLIVGQKLYRDIPEKMRTALQQTDGAQAFCLGLLLSNVSDPFLQSQAEAPLTAVQVSWLASLKPWQSQMSDALRLPCLELCLPTLQRLSQEQRRQFIKQLEVLATLDDKLEVGEWVVLSLLRMTLFPRSSLRNRPTINTFQTVNRDIQTLLSAAVYNATDVPQATQQYLKVLATFDITDRWLLSKDAVTYNAVSEALWHLDGINFLLRKPLLQACADIVLVDGQVAVLEFEFLRVVAAFLDCPMPPLQDSINTATPDEL